MNGKGCIPLLMHVNNLEEMRSPFEYVDVLRKLKSMVDKCYGMTLDENFLTAIESSIDPLQKTWHTNYIDGTRNVP